MRKIQPIETYLLNCQQRICDALATEDGGKTFLQDRWTRDKGGYGISCVLEGGEVIERGGVNFSYVTGESLPQAASTKHPDLAGKPFHALGMSLVIHPRNPYAPTCHLIVRFFLAENGDAPIWWFGGGFDLTPYYGFEEDCVHWHQTAKAACAVLGDSAYQEMKTACDDYFYLPHRQEARGIGGIFYDDLNAPDFDTCFAFMRSVGDHFITAYQPILARRKNTPYGEREREFQLYRRGRYAEFNLAYDRGTKFGLQFGGRIESILVSMPPVVNWRYDWQPKPGTQEAELYEKYLVPTDFSIFSGNVCMGCFVS